MNFKEEQAKFDVIKWYDSIVAGEDRCGTYGFCCHCDQSETEPCARAAFRTLEKAEEVEQIFSVSEEIAIACEEMNGVSFACEEPQAEPAPKALHSIAKIRVRVKK